jgi:hypothetical protein
MVRLSRNHLATSAPCCPTAALSQPDTFSRSCGGNEAITHFRTCAGLLTLRWLCLQGCLLVATAHYEGVHTSWLAHVGALQPPTGSVVRTLGTLCNSVSSACRCSLC